MIIFLTEIYWFQNLHCVQCVLNIMRYSKLVKKFRCVMIRVDSFDAFTRRKDSYACASVCRSFLAVNQSLQFAFIRYEVSVSISYDT